ncbi:unnamed protein product [Ilex paraguariensis]|uniref:Fe2OG dioxygenase domain-containing protein n=1 Tax=Ilex paraguariensis TaxID=185542 RepID=A0ABC8T2D2_9AQUA
MFSVKGLVEKGSLTSIPSKFVMASVPKQDILSEVEVIPTIDFSQLTSGTPDQRSKVIHDIGSACREWGFFMVINHSVPKKVMDDMLKATESFFDLAEDEKGEYRNKQLFDPIRYGTGFNVSMEKAFWRDYLKVHVHPHFNAPHKPHEFREISQEYCKRAREVASELFRAISISLGLEGNYINKAMEIGEGSQLLVVNLYPPCPKPEIAIGLPPHSDHGLLTLLIQNEVSGLQVVHKGKWVTISPLPNSILVNTGDHMEILTNGRYKSVVHQAVVNNKATRLSIGTAHGPTLDKTVRPAPELVDGESFPPAYRGITYREYMEVQQSNELKGKSCLDRIRI